MKKTIVYLLILAVAIGVYYGWYIYNRKVDSTTALKTDLVIAPEDLFRSYSEDETTAMTKFSGKILELYGVVRSTGNDSLGWNLVMEAGDDFFGINCAMEAGQEEGMQSVTVGDSLKIKGKCSGFNGDVVLVQCIVL